eukprot:819219-Rhodomonas_salina.1
MSQVHELQYPSGSGLVERKALLLCARLTDQQKPGLTDTKRREHRWWLDSYSQARAKPQKRFRTKNHRVVRTPQPEQRQ